METRKTTSRIEPSDTYDRVVTLRMPPETAAVLFNLLGYVDGLNPVRHVIDDISISLSSVVPDLGTGLFDGMVHAKDVSLTDAIKGASTMPTYVITAKQRMVVEPGEQFVIHGDNAAQARRIHSNEFFEFELADPILAMDLVEDGRRIKPAAGDGDTDQAANQSAEPEADQAA